MDHSCLDTCKSYKFLICYNVIPYLFVFQKSKPNFTYEVIVVDDGSKDKTSEVSLYGLMYTCIEVSASMINILSKILEFNSQNGILIVVVWLLISISSSTIF